MAHPAAGELVDERLNRRVGAVDRDHVRCEHGEQRPVGGLHPRLHAARRGVGGTSPNGCRNATRASCCATASTSVEGRLAEIAAAATVDGDVVLCGYSLGGRLALHAALRDPGRYARGRHARRRGGHRGAGGAYRPPGGRREARRLDGDAADRGDRRALGAPAAVRRPVGAAGARPSARAAAPGPALAGAAAAHGGAGDDGADLGPRWRRSTCRCWRSPARATSATAARRERMAAEAPRGYAAVIEHAGHAAHLQRPGEFADALLAFIDERVRSVESVDEHRGQHVLGDVDAQAGAVGNLHQAAPGPRQRVRDRRVEEPERRQAAGQRQCSSAAPAGAPRRSPRARRACSTGRPPCRRARRAQRRRGRGRSRRCRRA